MADGFLAPTGRFYPKTENFHAQTARAILGPEGDSDQIQLFGSCGKHQGERIVDAGITVDDQFFCIHFPISLK